MSNRRLPGSRLQLVTVPNGDRIDPHLDPADASAWPPDHEPMVVPAVTTTAPGDIARACRAAHDHLIAVARPARRSRVILTTHDNATGRVALGRIGVRDDGWATLVKRLRNDDSLALVIAWCIVDRRVHRAGAI